MNEDKLLGKWEQLKGEVKQQWGELTDDDVTKLDGKTDSLVGKIHERYGHAKEAVAREVGEWVDKFDAKIDSHKGQHLANKYLKNQSVTRIGFFIVSNIQLQTLIKKSPTQRGFFQLNLLKKFFKS